MNKMRIVGSGFKAYFENFSGNLTQLNLFLPSSNCFPFNFSPPTFSLIDFYSEAQRPQWVSKLVPSGLKN